MANVTMHRKRRAAPYKKSNLGIWLGADGAPNNTPTYLNGVKKFEKRFNCKIGSVMWNAEWGPYGGVTLGNGDTADGGWNANVAVNLCRRWDAAGYLPTISWQPRGSRDFGSGSLDPANFTNWSNSGLTQVNAGVTSYITEWANAFKTYGKPVVIRFAQEMTSDGPFTWKPSGMTSGGVTGVQPSAAAYVNGFKYIVHIFKNVVGTTNVKFFWCPDKPYTYDRIADDYYPGDAYCDIVGWDAYNSGNDQAQHVWKHPHLVHEAAYQEMKHIAPTKPMWIGEFGVGDSGGDGGEWWKEFFGEWLPIHPEIEMVQLFFMDMRPQGQGDWDSRSANYGGGPATKEKEEGLRHSLVPGNFHRAQPLAKAPNVVPGLIGWYKAGVADFQSTSSATTAASSESDPIGWVVDQSGANNHINAPANGQRPLLRLNAINGKSAWDFDGSDDVLADTSFAMGATTSEITVLMAFKVDTYVNWTSPLGFGASGVDPPTGLNSLEFMWADQTPRWMTVQRNGADLYSRNIYGSSLPAVTDWHVWGSRLQSQNGYNWFMGFVNGIKLDEDRSTLGQFNPTRFSLGGTLSAAGFQGYNNITVHEVVIFNRALKDREYLEVSRYMQREVGV